MTYCKRSWSIIVLVVLLVAVSTVGCDNNGSDKRVQQSASIEEPLVEETASLGDQNDQDTLTKELLIEQERIWESMDDDDLGIGGLHTSWVDTENDVIVFELDAMIKIEGNYIPVHPNKAISPAQRPFSGQLPLILQKPPLTCENAPIRVHKYISPK